MVRLHTPQEIEVHYILPALRRSLSRALKAQGKSQKEIALLLNVTESAVSQYLNDKRATSVELGEGIEAAIQNTLADTSSREEIMAHTQALLRTVRKEGITCTVCKPITGAPQGCQICFR